MPVIGLAQLNAAIDRISVEAGIVAKSIVTSGAATTVREAQANFQGSHKKGQPHTGSEQPNVVSGTLRRSIHYTIPERVGPLAYASQVGPSTVYGRAVELGYAKRNMRPHPYFIPAARKVTKRLPALAVAEWSKFLG